MSTRSRASEQNRLRCAIVSKAHGRYESFPRSAWICVGLGVLMLTASLKFALVDDALDVAIYPLFGCIGFLVWPAFALLLIGTFVVTDDGIQGRRRIGEGFAVARSEIARIEPYGSNKFNTLGVRIVRTNGAPIVLARISPEPMIVTLLDYGRGEGPTRAQPAGLDAFSAYARGEVPGQTPPTQ